MRRCGVMAWWCLVWLMVAGCGAPRRVAPRGDEYLLAVESPAGISARRDVFRAASAGDPIRAELLSLRILGGQLDDGSWGNDPTATGAALRDLFLLNVMSRDDPEIVRAADFILSSTADFVVYAADSPVWGKDWVALYALNLWGFGDRVKVRETVHTLAENLPAWWDGHKGRCASVILRALTLHPVMAEGEMTRRIVEKLGEAQLPDGRWDLGEGTSQLAILCALVPLAELAKVREQITRCLPAVLARDGGRWRDSALAGEEAYLAVVRALDAVGLLEAFRKGELPGERPLSLEVGLFVVTREAENARAVPHGDTALLVDPAPVVLGPEIASHRPVLGPEPGRNLVRLLLSGDARQKVAALLKRDATVEVALLLSGKVIATGALAGLMDEEGLVFVRLLPEDAVRLDLAVGRADGVPVPASGKADGNARDGVLR